MDHKLTREEIELIKSGRAYLVDVRSSEEVAEWTSPYAIHWDAHHLVEGRFPNIPKDKPVFVYCRSGVRAASAQRLLGGAGFTDAHSLGGLDGVPPELR